MLCIVATSSLYATPSIAEKQTKSPLFNPTAKSNTSTQDDSGKRIKGMSWRKAPEEKREEKPEEPEANTQEETAEELTPSQELWKKYKDLAAGKGVTKKTEAKDETNNEEPIQEKKPESQQTQGIAPDAPGGIRSILENYKNTQENKGKMNSRSFGKID